MPGRPKTKRRRHVSEKADSKYPTRKFKVPRSVRCGNCLELGHNKSSCMNPTKTKEPGQVNKIGRPKRGETITPVPSGEGISRTPTTFRRTKMVAKRGGRGSRDGRGGRGSRDGIGGTGSRDGIGGRPGSSRESEVQDDDQKNMEALRRDLEESGYLPEEIAQALAGMAVGTEAEIEEQAVSMEDDVEEHADTVDDGDDQEMEHERVDGELDQEIDGQQMEDERVGHDSEHETSDDQILTRKRRNSERIIKNKLKKFVWDPDGGVGASVQKAVDLD